VVTNNVLSKFGEEPIVNEHDYNYERGYALAIAKGASDMIADEFAQVFADPPGVRFTHRR
jgi:hypothetical protein